MLHVSEISTAEGFNDVKTDWDDLLQRSRNDSVFQTWEWLFTCWNNFGHGNQLLIAGVWDDERLIGLAPMQISSVYGLPLRRLQFLGTHVSDYLDFILDADCADTARRAILGWLDANERRWDLLDLQNLPSDPATIMSDLDPCWHCTAVEQDISPYMRLPESWDEMMSGMGKKHRQEIRRSEKLIYKEFQVAPSVLCDEELGDGLESLFRLHSMRWQKQGFSGVVSEEEMRIFYREVAYAFAERGWLRMQGLKINGELQSVNYCFAYKGKGYGYLSGWDPSLAKFGVGTTLSAYSIRDAVECGCREFDFLRGNESYKSRWTDEHRTIYRMLVWRRSLRSRLSALLANAECRMGYRTKAVVGKVLRKKVVLV